ncbi:Hydrogenase transcriptional regulatory protein hupR1 [Rubripirellula amarantea]|uniref:Hydrogenase transcriptional regulatory protein hupR1 n=1 Tax=Rubripirellula amarantea TaxID=2527999 RepID=A0A5C5WKD6_9BACT|nr:response regulator [Rubripirellula amarantea]TWT50565.1 Hydrogenase transcriptional regulatory protein hupR1 [Rubripirellula amarantea]
MLSILIVDDDVNLLSGLRRALHDQPYDLFTANSAEMAIDMFHRKAFDLVLVDQKMSGLSGAELIAWIAQEFPDTVRLMLTGHADVNMMMDAINNGKVFRFLTKPSHSVDIALAILEGLESKLASAV